MQVPEPKSPKLSYFSNLGCVLYGDISVLDSSSFALLLRVASIPPHVASLLSLFIFECSLFVSMNRIPVTPMLDTCLNANIEDSAVRSLYSLALKFLSILPFIPCLLYWSLLFYNTPHVDFGKSNFRNIRWVFEMGYFDKRKFQQMCF